MTCAQHICHQQGWQCLAVFFQLICNHPGEQWKLAEIPVLPLISLFVCWVFFVSVLNTNVLLWAAPLTFGSCCRRKNMNPLTAAILAYQRLCLKHIRVKERLLCSKQTQDRQQGEKMPKQLLCKAKFRKQSLEWKQKKTYTLIWPYDWE